MGRKVKVKNLTIRPDPRSLLVPEKYRNMYAAIKNDPPKGNLALALDMYMMAVIYLGSPPWGDETLSKCLAFGIARGWPEGITIGPMCTPVLVASYRWSLRGGCQPDLAGLIENVSPWLQDLYWEGPKAKWMPALMERYGTVGWEESHDPNNPLAGYRVWIDKADKDFFSLRTIIWPLIKKGPRIRIKP